MSTLLTIGIPTCGRPAAIAACLDSVQRHVGMDHRVIVVDSLITDRARALYASYPNLTCLAFDSPKGPAESRMLISEALETPFLLFLDDDNLVTPGSVSALMRHLEAHPEVDIASGGWIEEGRLDLRALGQYLHFGRSDAGDVVYRSFLTIERARTLGITAAQVDACLATMLLRREVFARVAFDSRFDFFYELLDFFMQCRGAGLRIEALPGALFEHHPLPYDATTRRQTGHREDDERRFAEKWGVTSVGPIGFTPARAKAAAGPIDGAEGGALDRLRRLTARGSEPKR